MSLKPVNNWYVFCFGSGEFGQTTQLNDVNIPVPVLKGTNFSKVFAGGWNSAAISLDGDLMVWGRTSSFKTTDQSANLFNEPKEENSNNSVGPSSFNVTPLLVQSNAKSAALNDNNVIILNQTGSIHFTSFNNQTVTVSEATNVFSRHQTVIIFQKEKIFLYTPLQGFSSEFQLPSNEIPIHAAITHKGFAILSDQHVLRVYLSSPESTSTSDCLVETISEVVDVAASNDKYIILKNNSVILEIFPQQGKRQITGINGTPISLFAGGAHYGCITFEGDCWTWGAGTRGQLGTGSFSNSFRPAKIILKDGNKVISAAAGEEHTILLAINETMFVPTLPDAMKGNDYLKMIRIDASISGAFVASEFDSKF